MKKVLYLLSLFIHTIIFSTSCENRSNRATQTDNYIIAGDVPGLDTGIVYLSEFVANAKKDSVQIKNGKFSFKGRFSHPVLMSLQLSNMRDRLLFFGENANIRIVVNKENIDSSSVTGSVSQNDYLEYLEYVKSANDNINALYKKTKDYTRFTKQQQDSITNISKLIIGKRNDTVISFVKKHPDAVVSGWALRKHFLNDEDIDKLNTLYELLDTLVKNTSFGNEIKNKLDIETRLSIGMMAPEFSETDSSGNLVSLKNFKGLYVLVEFWASSCAPCRIENPNLVRVYEKFNKKAFKILAVSLDDNKKLWLRAIHKDKLNWVHVSDLNTINKVATLYGVTAIPRNFLLDPDGKIIAKDMKSTDLEKKLEEVFAK